jgi:hypothetical protein
MGFAAYEAARSLQQRAIIVDTAHGRIIDLIPPTAATVPIEITLEQYLSCYGRQPVPAFSFDKLSVSPQKAIEAAHYLAHGGEIAVEALDHLRSCSQGKGKRTIPFKKTKPLSPQVRGVLRELEAFGLIANLQEREDGRVRYTILNEMDWKYLEGTWLEVFVWDQVRHCQDDQGNPLFRPQDLGLSFEILSDGACKEIDVGYVYHGQLIHASCKTETKSFKTRYLDELRAVSSLVGGRFVSRLFITNAFPPPPDDPDYGRFLTHAQEREIVVVTGQTLPQVSEILKRQALYPNYWRI